MKNKTSITRQRKHIGTLLLALVVAIFAAGLLDETVLANGPNRSEPFDPPTITPGSLNGQGTPGAWRTPWLARPGQEVVDVTGRSPLSYQVPNGGLVDGGPQVLEVTGSNDSLISRRFADSYNSDIYISYLFQITDGSVSNNDFAGFCFNNQPWCDFIDIPAIGLKAEMGPETMDLMVRNTRSSDEYVAQVAVGEIYFVVGHLYKSSDRPDAPYDRFELWVNPAYQDAGTPQVVSTGVSDLSEVNFIALRTVNNAGDTYLFDQLTVGPTWDAVVPPPTVTAVTLAHADIGNSGALPQLWLLGLLLGLSVLSIPVLRRR